MTGYWEMSADVFLASLRAWHFAAKAKPRIQRWACRLGEGLPADMRQRRTRMQSKQ